MQKPDRSSKGYLATYIGSLIPFVFALIIAVPIILYTRTRPQQLELGGLLFVLLTFFIVLGGIILAPLGIYFALKRQRYSNAGRTAWYLIILAVVLYILAILLQILLESVTSKTLAKDAASSVGAFFLLLLPFIARWLVVRG